MMVMMIVKNKNKKENNNKKKEEDKKKKEKKQKALQESLIDLPLTRTKGTHRVLEICTYDISVYIVHATQYGSFGEQAYTGAANTPTQCTQSSRAHSFRSRNCCCG